MLYLQTLPTASVSGYLNIVLISAGLMALLFMLWWQVGHELREEITETRHIGTFTSLELRGSVKALVTIGPEPTLVIRGQRRSMECLLVRQQHTSLRVANRFFLMNPTRDLLVTLTVPHLEQLHVQGASLVQLKDTRTNAEQVTVSVRGASNVSYEGQTATLTADLKGASRLTLAGGGQTLLARLSGASLLHANRYECLDSEVTLTGACLARVWAQRRLAAVAGGASKVLYWGQPRLTARTSGASVIVRAWRETTADEPIPVSNA